MCLEDITIAITSLANTVDGLENDRVSKCEYRNSVKMTIKKRGRVVSSSKGLDHLV